MAYHRIREALVAGIVQYYHINGKDNPADVLAKFLPHSTWWPLMKPLLYWIKDDKNDNTTMAKEDEHRAKG